MTSLQRNVLNLPAGHQRLLLHACCAPCSGAIIEALQASGISYSIFFYNPNIHPVQEYALRKQSIIRFAEKHGVPFIDADYDTDAWFARTRGLELEPERGRRCTVCFDMRLEKSALYAQEHGYDVFASSLGISRYKNIELINARGHHAASRYPGLAYWDFNWRKQGGSTRMVEIAKREAFYRQEYCGCEYSLRDANRERMAKGDGCVRIGLKYYGQDESDVNSHK